MTEYIKPEIEIVIFETEDVITTSVNNFSGDEKGENAHFDP
ncbi:hypothetical protein [Ruminococcus flavefaciens]|nr:hypothetical protein [Ruminococcus flavefaciens]